ncbi:hypothetical protein CBR_g50811 [Chara braunii]|uniref:Uncharacterized protein n=1 Tax=Chara braunii TaxID=69332 RepID=A0A388M7H8_CHABU|nr:hypothetical protein CBR_g50811 [Chara braunii]|eukprot:GBG90465.1 hypothetical protein CBR_g50811 [Chara braunii]
MKESAVETMFQNRHIPKVVDMLRTRLDLEPKPHPYEDEAVVRGAALFADCNERVMESDPIPGGRSPRTGPDSVPAVFGKSGGRSPHDITRWKQVAEELPVHEWSEWEKYTCQVEKREYSCPGWLWSIILEWKRDIDGWLGKKAAGGIKEFATRFVEFRRACEYAFGALRARPNSGRKFLVVDCWKSNDIKDCLRSLQASRGPELCDMVISMPLQELRKRKERIAEMEGIGLAALGLSPKATPNALMNGGIPYVLLEAGPAVTGSGDPEDLCSGWNKLVGEQVSLALQAGLQVVLRLGRDDCDDVHFRNEAFKLEDEKLHCGAQLRDIVGRVGKDFRNIAIAYLPPRHMLASAIEAAAAEAQCDIVQTVRHIRRVIGDLVNDQAADTTRILIGGCKTADTWHALLSRRHEIDGFLLEAGLREPHLFDQLLLLGGPSRRIRQERGGKVLLCGGQQENVTLSEYDMVWLSAVTDELMGTEEVLWIATKCVSTVGVGSEMNLIREINGSNVLLWREGHIMTDYRGEVGEEQKVTIVPIVDCDNNSQGLELADALSTQLSVLRAKLAGKGDTQWSQLLLEYRPADGVNFSRSLFETVERTHVLIRRWVLANLGAEAAQEVRIVCFLEEQVESETRRQIANLPHVDGVSLRLPERRTISRPGLSA